MTTNTTRTDQPPAARQPAATVLRVHDLSFSYSGPTLKGVSFDAREGELLALLGPNGSGKSTLLKLIVGMLKPEGGSVAVLGKETASISRREAARLIGYVAQESSVRFPLTAKEYVLQGRFAHGQLLGFESERDVEEAGWAMQITGTDHYAGRYVNELSGGERQRVMLARALASRPRLLVLDEPVANLDIAHQVKVLVLIRKLALEQNLTALVVTHELNLAAEFASRMLLLKSGGLIAEGTPRDVMTEGRLRDLFETDLVVDENPASGAPRVSLRISRDS